MKKIKYEDFIEAEKIIGYQFKNKALLVQAFTRRSYSEENTGTPHNEVLEFIGDSALGNVIVKMLSKRYRWRFDRGVLREEFDPFLVEHGLDPLVYGKGYYSDLAEDELSRLKIALVRSETLAAATERAGLERFLFMSRGDVERGAQNETSVKEDLFEAIVGAIAIDSEWDWGGMEAFVERVLDPEALLENGFDGEPDYEAELAAWLAEQGKKPVYKAAEAICDELPVALEIDLGEDMLGEVAGYGKTEAGARRAAAKCAMRYIRTVGDRSAGVINAVGEPDYERAINQLQELWQKKLIPKPEYTFHENGRNDSGNPRWGCECEIKGLVHPSGYWSDFDSKAEAKKSAAYEALMRLVGRKI